MATKNNRSKITTKAKKKQSKTQAGSGGFELMSLVRWPRVIALVLVVSLLGGLYVWRSQAATGYKNIASCGADISKALANTACADDSAQAIIYRLYAGGPHKRQPDASGFKYWSLELASGKSVQSIAATFIGQTVGEPKVTTLTLSNGDFVIRMYEKLLGRTPDLTKGGGAYWLGEVNKRTQDNVLASFIATDEVKAKNPGITLASAKTKMGLTTKESSIGFVKDLYRYMNNQTGKQSDWEWWNNEITSGRRTRAMVLSDFAQLQTAKNYHRSGFATYAKVNATKIQETSQEIESKRTGSAPKTGSTGSSGSSSGSGSSGSGTTSGGSSGSSTNTNSGTVESVANTGSNPHVCNSPYPGLSAGSKNTSNGRKDACVSAVQFNLGKATPGLSVTGTVDAATVAAIKSFQAFFKQAVTGTLTPAQVKSIADVWGVYKTDGTTTAVTETGSGGSTESATSGGGGYMDITFVADGVGEDVLQDRIQQTKGLLATLDPYSKFANRIAYHAVVPADSAGMCQVHVLDATQQGSTTRICDKARVHGEIAAKGAPADEIIVISSASFRANAGGGIAKVPKSASVNVIVHELSHLLGLSDEYISTSFIAGWDAQDYLGVDGQCISAGANVDTSILASDAWRTTEGPWSAWKNLPDVDWTKGCSYGLWYRPSPKESMMKNHDVHWFNSVSVKILSDEISNYTN